MTQFSLWQNCSFDYFGNLGHICFWTVKYDIYRYKGNYNNI